MVPARREALRRAVEDARRDAESLAAAVGRSLGELALLETGSVQFNSFENASVSTGLSLTEFGNAQSGIIQIAPTPRDVVVRANVSARWRLRP
jgi:hypothetical protein